jgi:hypothetical protein
MRWMSENKSNPHLLAQLSWRTPEEGRNRQRYPRGRSRRGTNFGQRPCPVAPSCRAVRRTLAETALDFPEVIVEEKLSLPLGSIEDGTRVSV